MTFKSLHIIIGTIFAFGIADVSAMKSSVANIFKATQAQHEAMQSLPPSARVAFYEQQSKTAVKVAETVKAKIAESGSSSASSADELSEIISSVASSGGKLQKIYEIARILPMSYDYIDQDFVDGNTVQRNRIINVPACPDLSSMTEEERGKFLVDTVDRLNELSEIIPDNFMEGKNDIAGSDFGKNLKKVLRYSDRIDRFYAEVLDKPYYQENINTVLSNLCVNLNSVIVAHNFDPADYSAEGLFEEISREQIDRWRYASVRTLLEHLKSATDCVTTWCTKDDRRPSNYELYNIQCLILELVKLDSLGLEDHLPIWHPAHPEYNLHLHL